LETDVALNLGFSEDQSMLIASFQKFFEEESSIARVRAAEPLGFDADLQRALGAMGALSMRLSEEKGGGFNILDAVLVSEQAGRQLASAPLFETIVATRLLARSTDPRAQDWLAAASAGEKVVTLALHEVLPGVAQVVPAGAVADGVLILQGEEIALAVAPPPGQAQANHGSQPIASLVLAGEGFKGERISIASGPGARAAFLAAVEEWKLLTAAGLNGVSRRALELAVDYAKERTQFGRLIGSYQAIAHPLANQAIDVSGSELLTWWAASRIADQAPDAAAAISMAYWWACRTADRTTRRAIHTYGGYGVTLEYDLQLYFRRAKAWPLVMGDPADELARAGERLWMNGGADPAPESADVGLDFEFGPEADALAEETRRLLAAITSDEWREAHHWSFDGYDPVVNRQIGEAGLVHPAWPKQWGGRDAPPYSAALALSVWDEYGVTGHCQSVTHFVGSAIMHFGSAELQNLVLPDFGKGLTNACLGYSEPHAGSDIFAARTRSEWDESRQEWVINGQKIFTSGANVSDYVFLVTRSDPDRPKHEGITLFLVPLKTPGIEIHPIFTVGDERTNSTFYSDVRIPDTYRIGPVNGGLKVLAGALVLEHGAGFSPADHALVQTVVDWARKPGPDGRPRLENPGVRSRISRVKVHAHIQDLLSKRAIYNGVNNPEQRTAYGPMSKVFRSEKSQSDLADLLDLTAPQSLFHSKHGLGEVESDHRAAQVGTIYGGTTEVHLSMIAEVGLGLPRSR
jgi:alkylation response protein AidB-like acyl-CoA dehydrogenase